MSHPAFSPAWLNQCLSDPYAILGVSVAADDQRILRRYRTVAKQLHPDTQMAAPSEHQAFVHQVLPKLVNPAYQRLKREKGRSEVLATLRFKVRRLSRDQQLNPQTEGGRGLLKTPEEEVDLVYEHVLGQLCDRQYGSLAEFEAVTQEITELNLIYLKRKMGEIVIREKRTGLMATSSLTSAPSLDGALTTDQTPLVNYGDRHFRRAEDYLKAENATAAIQELKDAIKLDPKNSNYHCLIGQAYLLANLPGMARVHVKQALRLEPGHRIAQSYARQLNLDLIDLNPAPARTVGTPPGVKKNSVWQFILTRMGRSPR
ncbi:MAG: DnaJ domain-containing protein [Cyanobacteria bacterium REEB459]|nr:DnaJ domain-containing protein [Cyanobacteria bacterium REEB459]